ncbi:MAG: hypothetical protein ABFC96_01210 [Thermoguttaceae bacterium]
MREPISPLAVRDAWQRLAWALLFASAMGMLEAICVIYLRRLVLPAGGSGVVLPPIGRYPIEHIREACTLLMLLATACLAASNWRSGLAFFFYMFGVWDIVYYVGLRWLAHWPASWTEWDCLFLIPEPWYGPVLAPMLISGYFILACGLLVLREDTAARLRLSAPVLGLQAIGFCLWYWSFVKDSDRIQAEGHCREFAAYLCGLPRCYGLSFTSTVSYSWPLLAAGLGIAMVGLWRSTRLPKTPAREPRR